MSNPSPVCCQCQQVGALSRFVCKFLVHVDSSVRSGDVIQTNLPSPSPATTRFSVSSNKKQTVDDGVRAVDSDVWRDEILFLSLPRERERKKPQSKQSNDAIKRARWFRSQNDRSQQEGRSYVFPRRPDHASLAGLYCSARAKNTSNLLFIYLCLKTDNTWSVFISHFPKWNNKIVYESLETSH